MNRSELLDEAAGLLSALIRFDTTNPPGNELECARFLAGWLGERGVAAEVVESAPGRGNVVALVPGDEGRKPLLVMGHLDVVPAGDPAKWKRDPFGGEVAEGCVWGRGAIDCKGFVAALAVTVAELAKGGGGGRPVRFLATADEEVGGAAGIGWIIENRPDLADCWASLTEGGGEVYDIADRRFASFMIGEKGQLRARFTIRGTQEHAAIPGDDQAMYVLGEVLRRLEKFSPEYRVLDSNRGLLDRLVGDDGPLSKRLERGDTRAWEKLLGDVGRLSDRLPALFRAVYADTLAPTMVRGSDKVNVIPGEVVLICDCRLLPGSGPEEKLALFKKLVGDLPVEVTVENAHPASASDPEHPVVATARELLPSWDPRLELIPTICLGGTDSRQLRWAGYDAYGYIPFPSEPNPPDMHTRVHGVNERLELEILGEITRRTLGLVGELRRR
jgi:acetylornithine deacetylase/succinyl-diaminopimelate desuccinylase-like protein